ncbi:MAG: bifunctional riboflavin kinase/FAD synthetase [Clostridia bacterium]|nr:bifunctional riboflavin kinase/FAD synthetase [Clostridia bacterium]
MKKSVCALGFFDGVHKAHTELLSECVAYAKEHNLKSVALTFEKSPLEYFGKKIKYLTTLGQKKELMHNLGIDDVHVLNCDGETLSLSCEEFIDSILVDKLNACAVFCGFNYTFGKNAQGDSNVLKKLCKERNIEVFVIPCMNDGNITVSSSEIRNALSKGDVEAANKLLNRPFEVKGVVQEGKKLGRLLNFPTANIYPDNLPDLPYGVYATKTTIDNMEYISVTNIGVNPTVNDNNLRIETFIKGFSGDIYQKEIKITFYKFLRAETKFSSVEELKNQIASDCENTTDYFKGLHE